jgi:hypothetical protein
MLELDAETESDPWRAPTPPPPAPPPFTDERGLATSPCLDATADWRALASRDSSPPIAADLLDLVRRVGRMSVSGDAAPTAGAEAACGILGRVAS